MASKPQICGVSLRWKRRVEKGISISADQPQSVMTAAEAQIPSHGVSPEGQCSMPSLWTP
jgi:hypothetical protein